MFVDWPALSVWTLPGLTDPCPSVVIVNEYFFAVAAMVEAFASVAVSVAMPVFESSCGS